MQKSRMAKPMMSGVTTREVIYAKDLVSINYLIGIDSALPTPHLRADPPNLAQRPPNQYHKFCYVQELYKMTKVLEDGRENG